MKLILPWVSLHISPLVAMFHEAPWPAPRYVNYEGRKSNVSLHKYICSRSRASENYFGQVEEGKTSK